MNNTTSTTQFIDHRPYIQHFLKPSELGSDIEHLATKQAEKGLILVKIKESPYGSWPHAHLSGEIGFVLYGSCRSNVVHNCDIEVAFWGYKFFQGKHAYLHRTTFRLSDVHIVHGKPSDIYYRGDVYMGGQFNRMRQHLNRRWASGR